MSTILHISASIRGAESVSRTLGTKLAEGFAQRDGAAIVERDLSATPLPFVSADRFAANLTPVDERTKEQADLAAIADELIAELQAADTIVLSIPVYNFGAPASVKAWADLVARAGTTFRYTSDGPQGLLTGKKAYLAFVSGGTPYGSEADFMSPWLKFFLGFIGIDDVTVVAADAVNRSDGGASIAKANEAADALLA